MSGECVAQWVGDVILVATFIAAVLYTRETKKIRLQTIRPKIAFVTRDHAATITEDPEKTDLYIRNIGAGAAINVTVELGDNQGFKVHFIPEYFSILEAGHERRLEMLPRKV